jgi:hypothetical protein
MESEYNLYKRRKGILFRSKLDGYRAKYRASPQQPVRRLGRQRPLLRPFTHQHTNAYSDSSSLTLHRRGHVDFCFLLTRIVEEKMIEVNKLNVDYNGKVYCLTIYDGAVDIQGQGGGPKRRYAYHADHGLPVETIYTADGHVWNHAAIHELIAAYEASTAKSSNSARAKVPIPRKSSLSTNESLEDSLSDLPLFKVYWQARRNGKFLRAGLINVRAVNPQEAQNTIREIRNEMLPMLGPGVELTFNSGLLGEDGTPSAAVR